MLSIRQLERFQTNKNTEIIEKKMIFCHKLYFQVGYWKKSVLQSYFLS
jgi:hypothetical protein